MVRAFASGLAVLVLAAAVHAGEDARPNTLTPVEIAAGWILLFDGETSFGTEVKGDIEVHDGQLFLGGSKDTRFVLPLQHFELRAEIRSVNVGAAARQNTMNFVVDGAGASVSDSTIFASTGDEKIWHSLHLTVEPIRGPDLEVAVSMQIGNNRPGNSRAQVKYASTHSHTFHLRVPAQNRVALRNVKLRPLGLMPLFNGKDLTGWHKFTSDAKRRKSAFTVTPDGWLNVKDGPGDLQTDRQFDDFVLQLECISLDKNLNSGIFFRCLPGEYQQGYEAQIQNGYKDGDRAKPVDFGTGAIYRRVPARKVVSNDLEWFTMTVLARGNHIATWVNGYQVVDFTDERKPSDNARNGSKTGKGALSIQGHDPTTNLSFRNIRIAELKTKQ